MIVAAAIRFEGRNYALPAPSRHHDIMHRWPVGKHHEHIQGFIDSDCGFVDRSHAWAIAKREGQLLDVEHPMPGTLFSEDVW